MSDNAAIQIADEEIKEIDRNLQFALGFWSFFMAWGAVTYVMAIPFCSKQSADCTMYGKR
jgi:hypothetical protein